ncbi:hypothetical protein NDU88_005710 [Pleurodeles waltl]|uniref:Uncharacterized protein n=1 Tax=Pleurodeles waltl TaxID=8319 RepID=A0AAV7PJD3_PLEWA|nr:hypothetical protein NDU88_005710 [Pleurodeles waltl]
MGGRALDVPEPALGLRRHQRGKGSLPRPRRVRRSCPLAYGGPFGMHRAGRVLPQASLLRGVLRRSAFISIDHTPTAGSRASSRSYVPHLRHLKLNTVFIDGSGGGLGKKA